MPISQLILSLLLCCMVTGAAAQKVEKKKAPQEKKTPEDWDHVFTKIEINATTNRQDWDSYMRRSAVLPDSMAKTIPAGTYNVLISFIVNTDGTLYDIKADNDPGYGLAPLAVKIFKGYQGKWRAAIQCGRAVKAYKKEPVIFVVAE
jgi:protein TonB